MSWPTAVVDLLLLGCVVGTMYGGWWLGWKLGWLADPGFVVRSALVYARAVVQRYLGSE